MGKKSAFPDPASEKLAKCVQRRKWMSNNFVLMLETNLVFKFFPQSHTGQQQTIAYLGQEEPVEYPFYPYCKPG